MEAEDVVAVVGVVVVDESKKLEYRCLSVSGKELWRCCFGTDIGVSKTGERWVIPTVFPSVFWRLPHFGHSFLLYILSVYPSPPSPISIIFLSLHLQYPFSLSIHVIHKEPSNVPSNRSAPFHLQSHFKTRLRPFCSSFCICAYRCE